MNQNGSCSPMTSVNHYSLHYVVCVFLVKSSACRRKHHRAHCVVGALLVKSSACRRNHYLALTLLVPSSSKRRLADAIIILLISSSLHPLLVMLSALRCNHHPSHYVINALRRLLLAQAKHHKIATSALLMPADAADSLQYGNHESC